jgi:peptidoglycan/LPS O-acetylase OafA/YrhL
MQRGRAAALQRYRSVTITPRGAAMACDRRAGKIAFMPLMPMTRISLPGLTGIRGVGAVWVVLFHAQNKLHLPVAGVGYLGVDMFFLLSGFVLSLAHRDLVWSWASYRDFLRARIARIFPLHWAVLALLGIILLAYPTIYRDDAAPYGAWSLMSNLLLTQNWGFGRTLTWNCPAWSLSTEWLVSLAFPLFLLAARRVSRTAAAAALCAGCLAAFVGLIWLTAQPDGNLAGWPGMARTALEFGAGCLLYRVWAAGTRANRFVALAGAALVLLGIAVPGWTSLAIFGFPILILQGATPASRVAKALSWRAVVFLGEISYSIYLLHWPLLLVSDRVRVRLHVHGIGSDLWFCGYFGLVLGLSVLTYYGIEQPARRWLKAVEWPSWKRSAPVVNA